MKYLVKKNVHLISQSIFKNQSRSEFYRRNLSFLMEQKSTRFFF